MIKTMLQMREKPLIQIIYLGNYELRIEIQVRLVPESMIFEPYHTSLCI